MHAIRRFHTLRSLGISLASQQVKILCARQSPNHYAKMCSSYQLTGKMRYREGERGKREGFPDKKLGQDELKIDVLSLYEPSAASVLRASNNKRKDKRDQDEERTDRRREQIYDNILEEHITDSGGSVDWEAVHNSFSDSKWLSKNWETRAMKTLSNQPKLYGCDTVQLSKSLMQYIREKGLVSRINLSFYMCALGQAAYGQEEALILEIFKELTSLTDVFERLTGAAVVQGLCKTNQWKQCIDIIDSMECYHSLLNHVICAAIHYGDMGTAWKSLEQIATLDIHPSDDVYHVLLNVHPYADHNGHVYRMLDYMRDNSVIPSKSVARIFADWFKRYMLLN